VYYKRETYSVTFSANGGYHILGFETQTVKYEANAFNVNYAKSGYTQDGWTVPITYITENIETMPNWIANDNEVVFNKNGGTGIMSNLVIKTNESANLTINSYTREGYTFGGWATSSTGAKAYDDEALYEMGTASTNNIYAVWNVIAYYATYNLNGGTLATTNPSTFNVASGTLPLYSPTKRGYTFGGWYDNISLTGSTYTTISSGSIGNKEFFAKWVADIYTINYVLNGGDNNTSNPSSYTIEDSNITLLDPTVADCTFVGWYDANSVYGNKVTTIKPTLLANYTLYAIWKYETEGIEYVLANGVAIVSGYTGEGGAVAILSSITIGSTVFLVPTIGDYAFSGKSTITNLSIAEGITSIGINAFDNCTSLTSISIPSTVTSIGDWAFYGCSALKSAIIPSSVSSMGEWAFAYCSSMIAYCGANSIPSEWDTYWNYYSTNVAHWGINTTNFIESNGLQFVVVNGNAIFTRYTGNGTSVTVPSSMTIAATNYNVTKVGMWAFANCTTLTSISIPSSVTSIEGQALIGCSSLTTLNIPFVGTSRASTGNSALFGYIFGWTAFSNSTETTQTYRSGYTTNFYIPTSLTTVNIENETILKYGAFSGCSTLASVTVGSVLTQISDYAFSGCTGLSNYTVVGNDLVLDKIGEYAFENCSNLSTILISESVATIGECAFDGCSSLTITCEILEENIPVGWDASWNIDNCTVVWGEVI